MDDKNNYLSKLNNVILNKLNKIIQNANPRPRLLAAMLKGLAGIHQTRRKRGSGEYYNREAINKKREK